MKFVFVALYQPDLIKNQLSSMNTFDDEIVVVEKSIFVESDYKDCLIINDVAPNKEVGLIFDHSDTHVNLGMASDIHYTELDDGDRAKAAKRKAKQKEESKPKECTACKYIKPAGIHACPKCGFAPKQQSEIEPIAGNLTQFKPNKRNKIATLEDKQNFYSELLGYAQMKSYNLGWAANKYKEYFGVWPNKLTKNPMPPRELVTRWIRHGQIKWAKGRKKDENSRASAQ